MDQWVESAQLVIAELMARCNHVMGSTLGAVEQIRQAEGLAEDARHVVHAVIGDHYKNRLASKWGSFDGRSDLAD
jgi:hypothetical protein